MSIQFLVFIVNHGLVEEIRYWGEFGKVFLMNEEIVNECVLICSGVENGKRQGRSQT